jgi:LEA14-like dessication related protein
MILPARLFTVLALLCGLFVTGCMTTPKVGEITVTIVEFTSSSNLLSQPRASLTLRFINENLIPVALSASKHKLYFNGTFVGEIENTKAVGLAPSSAKTHDVAIFFQNLALVRQLASKPNPVVSYRLVNVMEYRNSDEKNYLKSETNSTIDLSSLVGK